MRIIESKDLLDAERSYPLFFQGNYALYESKRGWKVVLIKDTDNAVIPIKIRATRFIKQAQYLYPPVKNGQRLSPEKELDFLKNLLSFCKQTGLCDFISPPVHFSLFQSVPPDSFYTELGIIVADITRSAEDLFKGFSANYKNEIRKAIAAGVVVKTGNEWFEQFYALYKSTHTRQNIYFDSKQDLKEMVQYVGDINCKIFVVGIENEIFGVALVLYNGDEAYYYYAGSIDNCPIPGANKMLQLEIMKWLKNAGVKRYLMGGYRLGEIKGTKYEGMQNFKMRFGAHIEKGFHFYSKVTWRYPVYTVLLKWYLRLRGVKQNLTGLNYKYN